MTYILGRREREIRLLLRGDCDGRLAIWNIPDIDGNKMKLARQESFENLPGLLIVLACKNYIFIQNQVDVFLEIN